MQSLSLNSNSSKYKYPHHSEAVKEFSEGRTGKSCPSKPVPFDFNEGMRVVQFKLSEVVEFVRTLPGVISWEQAVDLVKNRVGADLNSIEPNYITNPNSFGYDPVVIVAEQADAFVDDEYYTRDACGAHGINLDAFFDEVHDANMRKKWDDGTFHLKEVDGHTKVDKPPSWTGPDVESVAKSAFANGSW